LIHSTMTTQNKTNKQITQVDLSDDSAGSHTTKVVGYAGAACIILGYFFGKMF